MSAERRTQPARLDLIAGIVLAILAILVGLTIVLGQAQGLRVRSGIPPGGEVGPRGPLTLTFYDAVDPKLIEGLLDVAPAIPGHFNWPDPRTVQFIPDKLFQPRTQYTLRLNAGATGKSSSPLVRDRSWGFHLRPPLVAYLYSPDVKKDPEIWAVGADGSAPHALTHSAAWVFDFDAAADGNFLVYSVYNAQQGIDLWSVDRDGGNAHVRVDCGLDRCSTPSISPDGRIVAYAREAAIIPQGSGYGAPRVWVAGISGRETHPLFADSQILGYDPSWSPDGKRVASLDNVVGGIRVVEIATGQQDILPSTTGDRIAWSPDGNQALFTDTETANDVYRTLVYRADFTTHEISTVIGKDDDGDYAYGSLAWSPSGEQIVIGMRAKVDNPASSLWIVRPDLLGGPVIANDPQYDYSAPEWDPWGGSLVYQRLLLNAPLKSSVIVWQAATMKSQSVAEGIFPRWLP